MVKQENGVQFWLVADEQRFDIAILRSGSAEGNPQDFSDSGHDPDSTR